VDYTSLFGGTAAPIGVNKLMNQWASFLPRFEVTRHNLSKSIGFKTSLEISTPLTIFLTINKYSDRQTPGQMPGV
jgi:hypothetical protein